MDQKPSWQFNEMKQVGKDYAKASEVKAFDAFHGQFRDIRKENAAIIDTLSIEKKDTVIEFGTGTGEFAIQASSCAQKIYAVDVSRAMLEFAKEKAETRDISNIHFQYGGFLTYEHRDAPVDYIVSSLALHHLPDFWKGVALRRLQHMLKPKGSFLLYDVVYASENYEVNIQSWIEEMEKIGGEKAVEDVTTHIREEYSTFTWIMESLLENSGFKIDKVNYEKGVLAQYVCSKKFVGDYVG